MIWRWDIDVTGARDGVDPHRTTQIWIWSWIWIESGPQHDLGSDIDRAGDGVEPQKVQHKYGSRAGSRSGVNPPHDLRLDIDWTGAGDGMDPKMVEHKYGFRAGSRSGVNPPHDLMLDIDGTGARDGVDPKLRSKCYNPNMDLELDPDPELTPTHDL